MKSKLSPPLKKFQPSGVALYLSTRLPHKCPVTLSLQSLWQNTSLPRPGKFHKAVTEKKNRTFTKVQQGSQHFNSCVVKIYLRVMFTHKILQQYSNYTDSGPILKDIVPFEPHGLKFYRNFPLALKRTKLTKARP